MRWWLLHDFSHCNAGTVLSANRLRPATLAADFSLADRSKTADPRAPRNSAAPPGAGTCRGPASFGPSRAMHHTGPSEDGAITTRLASSHPARSRLFPAYGFREACREKTADSASPPVSSCTVILCAAQPDASPPLALVVAPRLCRQCLTVRIQKTALNGRHFTYPHYFPAGPCALRRT